MPGQNNQLTLKKIVGAMLFAARKPLKLAELKTIFADTPQIEEEAVCRQFAKVKESELIAVMEQIKTELRQAANGIQLLEVAGGYRLQTDADCAPWLRQLLNSGRPSRLSKPTLETLAIIAYRQPVTRAEIESVRGVNVDAIVRHLLDCQLIKITGRSNLPGHPMLYGTTQLFLEHFGLQSIEHLPGIEQLRRKEEERIQAARKKTGPEETKDSDEDEVEDDDDDEDEEDEETEEASPSQAKQPQSAAENEPKKTAPTQDNPNEH
jgi:segregation and condensation protein B